jgi:hypothetical protein
MRMVRFNTSEDLKHEHIPHYFGQYKLFCGKAAVAGAIRINPEIIRTWSED